MVVLPSPNRQSSPPASRAIPQATETLLCASWDSVLGEDVVCFAPCDPCLRHCAQRWGSPVRRTHYAAAPCPSCHSQPHRLSGHWQTDCGKAPRGQECPPNVTGSEYEAAGHLRYDWGVGAVLWLPPVHHEADTLGMGHEALR